jgi:hypothetical protein
MLRPALSSVILALYILCAEGFQIGCLIRALRRSATVPGRRTDLQELVCSSVCEQRGRVAVPILVETRQRRPKGYWKVFENVESEILQVRFFLC